MKARFTAIFAIALVVLFLAPQQSFAQSGTLTVYASGAQTLDQVINGDVTGGIQNHSVYKLVSVDTTYLLDATITTKSGISVVGVPDATTGRLPCVEADVLSDLSIPGVFFTLTGQGTRVMLKDLYLLGTAPNNANNTASGQGVQVSADSISLTIDNCVFDEISQFEVGYSSNWDKFYITNSKFRNGIDVASAYYVPELLRSENGAGAWSTDTIMVTNNTLLAIAMGPVVTTGITKYFDFSHNDVILTSKGPFWSEHVVNAKLDNNLFYDVYATGESKAEYSGGWDEIAPPRVPSIFYFNNLDSASAALLLGHAISGNTDYATAEAARKVEVKNNDYYWSSGLTGFWTAWDDTAHTDSLITPVFMNSQSMAMFSNTTSWPGFSMSGNTNLDPTFGASINAVLNPTDTTDGVGLLAWLTAVRNGTGTTQSYSYERTEVGTAADWTPTWPLPESADLKYTNSALLTGATDGTQVGDQNWFGIPNAVKKIPSNVPLKFNLSNNYPNPFNPSTTVEFSLAKTGNVNLKVYNAMGQLVKDVISNRNMASGHYSYSINMNDFASGIYFYTLQQNGLTLTKKMVLLK
jgi:Secretion system C-terminal sorting domain